MLIAGLTGMGSDRWCRAALRLPSDAGRAKAPVGSCVVRSMMGRTADPVAKPALRTTREKPLSELGTIPNARRWRGLIPSVVRQALCKLRPLHKQEETQR